jgi:hypothetical protein
MAKYLDNHPVERANPSDTVDTVLIMGIVAAGGVFLYSQIKKISPESVIQQIWDNTLGQITYPSCPPPFDQQYWSAALRDCMAADREFWCRVQNWVKLLLASGCIGSFCWASPNPVGARDWPAFREWVIGQSRPWAGVPDPGVYGPAEFHAYALREIAKLGLDPNGGTLPPSSGGGSW